MRAYWSGAPRWSRLATWRGDVYDQVMSHVSCQTWVLMSWWFHPSVWAVMEEWHAYLESIKHSDCNKYSVQSVSLRKKKKKHILAAAVSQQLPDKSAPSTETPSFSNKQYIIGYILFYSVSLSVWSSSTCAAAVMLYQLTFLQRPIEHFWTNLK